MFCDDYFLAWQKEVVVSVRVEVGLSFVINIDIVWSRTVEVVSEEEGEQILCVFFYGVVEHASIDCSR